MSFPTVAQIERLHQPIIEQTGGSQGLRDRGALESAVAQPQMGFGGQDLYPTLGRKSRRTGIFSGLQSSFYGRQQVHRLSATIAFLRAHGHDLSAPIDDAEQTVLRLAAGELSREDWTNWVQTHIGEFHK